MLLNSEWANPALLWKGLPKTGAVWRSKALLESEIMFLSAHLKNKKRIFSLSPSSALDQTQTNFPLPQSPGIRRGIYSPRYSRRKTKGTSSIQETPESPPKSIMGRWAPLPHTPALRTRSFGFYLVQSCKKNIIFYYCKAFSIGCMAERLWNRTKSLNASGKFG